ncbi:HNH endonuclease [Seongchinamella sediminis]|uniref:HNH endonuclease n=1 Tax=Seongchinamella sediminis TaxID=2283635 RepID=A0A3L7DWS1_9GAMM|nr:HNH endonuclease [Seongchinamella sediminis]
MDLSNGTKKKLEALGYRKLSDLEDVFFPSLYEDVSFEQAKKVLKYCLETGIQVNFSKPDWSDEQWHQFVDQIVEKEIVTWSEIAVAVCGELNPPQVGTAIASNASFQAKFPPRETMKNVMAWFYEQDGQCSLCGTHLFLEADHVISKQEFAEAGLDPKDADTLDNLQLLCKRCNVIKRPSHALGGISFAPAQSVLIWILLELRPKKKSEFYTLCRNHGLTMANIRFDEAWAFAEWLNKRGKYEIVEEDAE